jgi:GTP-binding protein YchF
LKVSIIGLSNTGKTTIFNALTGQNIETTTYATLAGEPHIGVVKVPDPRLDQLSGIFPRKKATHAVVEYIDYIGLARGNTEQNRKILDLIKDVDATVHVVRAFQDEAVVHPAGGLDPARDIEMIELELIFGDLELVEKRLDRMEEGRKRGKKPNEAEKKLLMKCKEHLEKEVALRNVRFSQEERDAMKPLQFLSTKPEIVVLNIGEKDLNTDFAKGLQTGISARYPSLSVITLCGKIEMEIAQLPPSEKRPFLDELGIDEPASNKLIHACYTTLGLISFLTVGKDEVRAWTIKKGTNAQKAAGKVHSDIERGFIKAEVVSFDDFISSGGMHTAREKGLLRLEGKTYIVKDGDMIDFRFNV